MEKKVEQKGGRRVIILSFPACNSRRARAQMSTNDRRSPKGRVLRTRPNRVQLTAKNN